MNVKCSSVLSLIIATVVSIVPHGECAETVFRKSISGTESLEVVRGDVEYRPVPPEQKEKAQKAFGNLPNVAAVVPLEYRQYHDILFRGAGQTAPVLVGRLSRAFDSAEAPTDSWHFGDAAKVGDKIFFVIMSGEGMGLYNFSTDGRDKNKPIRELWAPGFYEGELASKTQGADAIQLGRSPEGNLKVTVRGRNGALWVWVLSQGQWIRSPGPTFQLLSKKFSVDGKDWLLELSMDYKEDYKASLVPPLLASGFHVLLTKTPLSLGGEKGGPPITIWSLFRPSQAARTSDEPMDGERWSADAVVDPTGNSIYLAMANGKFPWVQIFDLNGKPREGGFDMGNTAIEEAYRQYGELTYRLFVSQDKVKMTFAPIDAIALQKDGEFLKITTTDNSKRAHQIWQISLTAVEWERNWLKVDEPKPK